MLSEHEASFGLSEHTFSRTYPKYVPNMVQTGLSAMPLHPNMPSPADMSEHASEHAEHAFSEHAFPNMLKRSLYSPFKVQPGSN